MASLMNSFVVKETAILTLTIDNWKSPGFVQVTSEKFSPPNSGHQFQLVVDQTDTFGLDHTLLALYYNAVEDLVLRYRISILDANGERHWTKEYLWHYQKRDYQYYYYNVTNYVATVKCNEFVVNRSLKLFCEVDILCEKSVSLSPHQIESFDKLSQNYQTLLESEKLSDFVVVIGDYQFNVHKAIFAARSAVFAAMFEHCETKEAKEGLVEIEDVNVEVFKELLQYIYFGKVESLTEQAADLFVAADKYQVEHLKSICEQSLISSLNIESVSSVLVLADMHNSSQLKLKCIEYIICNFSEVKQAEAWNQQIKSIWHSIYWKFLLLE